MQTEIHLSSASITEEDGDGFTISQEEGYIVFEDNLGNILCVSDTTIPALIRVLGMFGTPA